MRSHVSPPSYAAGTQEAHGAVSPVPCSRDRDARHRLRRVPHAGRRAQLFLRRRVPLEDGPGTRRRHRPVGRRGTPRKLQLPSVSRTPSHRAFSPAQFFTLSLGGMVTVRARLRNSAFANSVTARLSPSRSPRTAAEHVERLDLRRRSRRVDALVQRRDEVAREARAPRPPTNCSYCVSICAPCSAPRPRRSPSPPLTFSGNPDRDRVEPQGDRPRVELRETGRADRRTLLQPQTERRPRVFAPALTPLPSRDSSF